MSVPTNKAMISNEPREYELLPEGIYEAEVVDIVLKEGIQTKYGIKDKFYIYLGLLDEEYRGKPLLHFVSTSYTGAYEGGKASKLYEFVCAVMGEKVDDKEPLDINGLIGGKLKIVVKHNQSGDKTYANVTEVMSDKSSKLSELTEEEKQAILPQEEDVKPDEVTV